MPTPSDKTRHRTSDYPERTPEQVARGKRLGELRSKHAHRFRNQETEDDFQEACLRLIASRKPVDPGKENAWLRTTERRARIDRLKASIKEAARREVMAKAGLVRTVDDPNEQEIAESSRVALDEMKRNLGEQLGLLPEDQRSLLTWLYFEGQTVKAIAARLGIDPKAASARIARARASLRSRLDDS